MIDNTLLIKNLQSLEYLYVVFSQYTKMPYVECDPETFDDQIHIMTSEEEVQEFAKPYTEKKILLIAKKLPNAQAPGVLAGMFGMGINAVVFHHNGTTAHLQLEQIVKKPVLPKELTAQIPVVNPSLVLSAMYFLQELYRPVEHDKKLLKELEEEMIANLKRSKYVLAMVPTNPGEKLDPKNPKQPKSVNYIKDKEGRLFLPVYSDITEFQKFYKEKTKEVGMIVVTFDQLYKNITKEAKGLVLNPAGFGLQILTDQLEKIIGI